MKKRISIVILAILMSVALLLTACNIFDRTSNDDTEVNNEIDDTYYLPNDEIVEDEPPQDSEITDNDEIDGKGYTIMEGFALGK